MRDFHRLVVFVDEKVVLPQTWHESSARVGHGRGHVDQLDAAPETKALVVARPFGRLLRLLSMRRHHDRGDDRGDDQREAGHTETHGLGLTLLPTSITTIDVRDDAIFGTEADAVPADLACGGDRDGERRFAAGPKHRRVDGGAAAAHEAAIPLVYEHDRGDAVQRRARGRIADDAANGQSIAVAVVTQRHELERLDCGRLRRFRCGGGARFASNGRFAQGAARDDRERGHAAADQEADGRHGGESGTRAGVACREQSS